jgi:hypothetical protein
MHCASARARTRWQLTSSTALGDSLTLLDNGRRHRVEAGQVCGAGHRQCQYASSIVQHYGDLIVTGGNFSLARGSQGNGTGLDRVESERRRPFQFANMTTQNSNPAVSGARYVFADGAQTISFDNVTFGGGQVHFDVGADIDPDDALKGSSSRVYVRNYGADHAGGDSHGGQQRHI